MPAFSKSTAASLAQFIEYAYSMSAGAVPGQGLPAIPLGFPANFTVVAFAQATDDFFGYVNPAYYGFVAYSATLAQIIVAIRGTADPLEWLVDFEAIPTPFSTIPAAGNVEYGFFSVFQTLSFIDPSSQPFDLRGFLASTLAVAPQTAIILEGHSLGGAITEMLSLDCAWGDPAVTAASTVYTFAAPAPGDQTFATFYRNNAPLTYRVWNELDVVPSALAVFGFSQVDTSVEITPDWGQLEGYDFLSIACNHSLMTYQWLLAPQYPLLPSCQWNAAAATPAHTALLARKSAVTVRRSRRPRGIPIARV